ncbi:MAG TPA: hypothetical protein VMK12_00785, partial [Anaeromyxobacteraceae bacterium]|nr:hypothetical protein [Anaeromyxobacteraceae bacterium]
AASGEERTCERGEVLSAPRGPLFQGGEGWLGAQFREQVERAREGSRPGQILGGGEGPSMARE